MSTLPPTPFGYNCPLDDHCSVTKYPHTRHQEKNLQWTPAEVLGSTSQPPVLACPAALSEPSAAMPFPPYFPIENSDSCSRDCREENAEAQRNLDILRDLVNSLPIPNGYEGLPSGVPGALGGVQVHSQPSLSLSSISGTSDSDDAMNSGYSTPVNAGTDNVAPPDIKDAHSLVRMFARRFFYDADGGEEDIATNEQYVLENVILQTGAIA